MSSTGDQKDTAADQQTTPEVHQRYLNFAKRMLPNFLRGSIRSISYRWRRAGHPRDNRRARSNGPPWNGWAAARAARYPH